MSRHGLPYPGDDPHEEASFADGELARELETTRRALSAARARIDAVYGQGMIGIAETDLAGRFVTANAAYCALVGRSLADLARRRIFELIHPDDRRGYRRLRRRLLASRRGTVDERRYLRPDGRSVWVRRVMLPLPDATGRIAGVLAAVTDITGQRRRELEVRRLASIVEGSSDFIAIASLEGAMLHVNAAGRRMVGLDDAEAAKATRIADYHRPEDLSGLEERIRRTAAEGRVGEETCLRHFKTGEAVPVHCDTFLTHDPESGGMTNLVAIARDISERKRHLETLEKALIEARAGSKAKSEFLANISHELRTPLNAILGFTDLLASQRADGPDAEYLGLIRESGQKLLRLISDMIDLSRIELHALTIDPVAIDSRRLVEDCVAQIQPRIEARGVSVTTRMPFSAPAIAGDPLRLKQILMQLLSNAVKFTGARGRIEVGVQAEPGGLVRLEVADNGIGMSASELQTALQPFGQAAEAYTRSEDGIGLGLPLARRLAELHGGTLAIESAKGIGTRVSVILPDATATARQETRPQASRRPRPRATVPGGLA